MVTSTSSEDRAVNPLPSPFDHYGRLLEHLQNGWEIDPPVFRRPRWPAYPTNDQVYHFVLKNGERRLLLSIPCSSAVEQFIRDHHLRVDQL